MAFGIVDGRQQENDNARRITMHHDVKDDIEYPLDAHEMEKAETRREFFTGLGKWSKIVIGAALLGGMALPEDAPAKWSNSGGGKKHGGWHNGGWHNGGWHNGGWHNGGWHNGGWHNGGWHNGGWHNGGWKNKWHNGGWWNGGWKNKWHNGGWHNGGWHNGGWSNFY
jgi:hypothetical protein